MADKYNPFDALAVRARVARQHVRVCRATRIDARGVTGQIAGHHEPLRMRVHHMCARHRQLGVRDQADVHPGVHAQAGMMAGGHGELQRIERGILPRKGRPARLESADVVRVAAAARLHEQGVEPRGLRRVDERDDGGRRCESAALDPQRANFTIAGSNRTRPTY